ncbi:myelin and lymphocyte protein-like isoform X2 [Bufo gargarizans]|uniref:myelin and lymphocyte protein-like isoform X2 n=1 Tax=Bufo gargarizans TaxID=30331 RepID=UPI001CF487AA|nr:myelin and lymphocyte protein-like isoform X2 [Bufo gargarizans]
MKITKCPSGVCIHDPHSAEEPPQKRARKLWQAYALPSHQKKSQKKTHKSSDIAGRHRRSPRRGSRNNSPASCHVTQQGNQELPAVTAITASFSAISWRCTQGATAKVFGGLVWTLVASTTLYSGSLLQGWVMFVSVTLFVCTTILLFLYLVGAHGGRSTWTTLDAFYHYAASLMYLSASVLQAAATINAKYLGVFKYYQENIAAVVFCFLVTLVYVIHAVASLIRWKRSP